MIKKIKHCLHLLSISFFSFLILSLQISPIHSQEIPIATSLNSEMGSGIAYDGMKYFLVVNIDSSGSGNIEYLKIRGQFLHPTSGKMGGTFEIDELSTPNYLSFPGAKVVYDGLHYLVFWYRLDSTVVLQRFSLMGQKIGTRETIGTQIRIGSPSTMWPCVGDTTTLVIYVKNQPNNFLWGRFIGRSGFYISDPIQLSTVTIKECHLTYSGGKFLVVWQRRPESGGINQAIDGQLFTSAGSPIGVSFNLVSGDNKYRDNPVFVTAIGEKFLLTYHEQYNLGLNNWTLKGKILGASGVVESSFLIADSTVSPFNPSAIWDGSKYLLVWSEFATRTMWGKYFNAAGQSLGERFALLGPRADKTPIGGGIYAGGQYLIIGTEVNDQFSSGDIYARFLSGALQAKALDRLPNAPILYQNYPNPFNPSTSIPFYLPTRSKVSLEVFDLLGRKIATLKSNELMSEGTHLANWNAAEQSSGIYYYKLKTEYISVAKKLVLLK